MVASKVAILIPKLAKYLSTPSRALQLLRLFPMMDHSRQKQPPFAGGFSSGNVRGSRSVSSFSEQHILERDDLRFGGGNSSAL
jgi:hypothetical protein